MGEETDFGFALAKVRVGQSAEDLAVEFLEWNSSMKVHANQSVARAVETLNISDYALIADVPALPRKVYDRRSDGV